MYTKIWAYPITKKSTKAQSTLKNLTRNKPLSQKQILQHSGRNVPDWTNIPVIRITFKTTPTANSRSNVIPHSREDIDAVIFHRNKRVSNPLQCWFTFSTLQSILWFSKSRHDYPLKVTNLLRTRENSTRKSNQQPPTVNQNIKVVSDKIETKATETY